MRAFSELQQQYIFPIGQGLFTNSLILPRQRIAVYQGEFISPMELQRRTAAGRGGYAIQCTQSVILDCYAEAKAGRCLASMANSPASVRNMMTDTAVRANARLSLGQPFGPDGSRFWRASLIATHTIQPHQEILVSYSAEYVFPTSSGVPDHDEPEVIDLTTPPASPGGWPQTTAVTVPVPAPPPQPPPPPRPPVPRAPRPPAAPPAEFGPPNTSSSDITP